MAAAISLVLSFVSSTSLPVFAGTSDPTPAPSTTLISKPVKVFDEAPIQRAKRGTITKTVDFVWNSEYRPVFTDSPDGTGSLFFYDTLKVYLGGKLMLTAPSRGCDTLNDSLGPWIQPLDVSDYLTLGLNHVTVEIENTCGLSGNSDIWLTTYGMPMPSDTPTATPEPATPSANPTPSHSPLPSPSPAHSSPSVSPPAPAPAAPEASAPPVQAPPPPAPPANVPDPVNPPVAAGDPPASVPLTAAPSWPEAKPSAACGWEKFYGVRGSGETGADFDGYGETIGTLQGELQINLPGMKPEAVDYLAIPVNPWSYSYTSDYVNSVNGGVEKLYHSLKRFIANCPITYVLLAGYSQGAEVVDTVYARLSDEERRHIASVVLFGDPGFNPLQTSVDRGDFSFTLNGINVALLGDRLQSVSPGWENRVQSYCTQGDPICNYSAGNLPSCNPVFGFVTCPHGKYYERGWTDLAAAWVIKNLGTMPRL